MTDKPDIIGIAKAYLQEHNDCDESMWCAENRRFAKALLLAVSELESILYVESVQREPRGWLRARIEKALSEIRFNSAD